uniref:Uncharacterized protein n=1 Tax=Biomphalaria glabrata TaxID=6526 RepID=A0A2C9LZR3_BIOGL
MPSPKKNGVRSIPDALLSKERYNWFRRTSLEEVGWCTLCERAMGLTKGSSSLISHARGKKHRSKLDKEMTKKPLNVSHLKQDPNSLSHMILNKTPVVTIETIKQELLVRQRLSTPSTPMLPSGQSSNNSSILIDENNSLLANSSVSMTPSSTVASSPLASISPIASPTTKSTLSTSGSDSTLFTQDYESSESQIGRLKQEISVLTKCTNERAELCESTGNIEYIRESNVLRKIMEQKCQELKNLKLQTREKMAARMATLILPGR